MKIIPATRDHIPTITQIHNDNVQNSKAIWTLTTSTVEAREEWRAARVVDGFPVLVAVDQAGAVLGYGSYGTFRPAEGYRLTVEHSVYVAPEARSRGIGSALLSALVDHAKAAGFHAMIGAVEASNAASIALHQRNGFQKVGVLPQIGAKFDEWLDLALMHRLLDTDFPAGR